ncbi:syntaxin-4-like [Taeniopygia guttata]|uniref:syntaxin-4-like n=1 Tax=Taeniopygia guttata TaxID=59729 RepID=UPI003BB892BB
MTTPPRLLPPPPPLPPLPPGPGTAAARPRPLRGFRDALPPSLRCFRARRTSASLLGDFSGTFPAPLGGLPARLYGFGGLPVRLYGPGGPLDGFGGQSGPVSLRTAHAHRALRRHFRFRSAAMRDRTRELRQVYFSPIPLFPPNSGFFFPKSAFFPPNPCFFPKSSFFTPILVYFLSPQASDSDSEGEGRGGEGRLLPPEDPALAQAQYLRSALGALSLRAAALERLQERALATPLPPPELQEDLQRVRDEIQDLTREIQAGLRGLEPSGSDSGPGSVRERLRRTQHGLLAQQFFGVTERLQTVQSRYRQRNLERIQRQLQIAGHAPLSEEELEQLLESGQTQIFVPNAAGAARAALDEAGTRHREIRRLERGLRELGELFRLLGSTVEAQGDVIDRIERHVQDSGAELGKGRSHLRGAGQRRRGARKKRLALAACASAAILVLAAIVAASVAAG